MPRDTIKVKTTASLTLLLNVSHCHSIVLSTNKVLLIIHANWGKPEIIHNVDTLPLLGGWPVKIAMTIWIKKKDNISSGEAAAKQQLLFLAAIQRWSYLVQ